MKMDISYKVQNWKPYNEALRQRVEILGEVQGKLELDIIAGAWLKQLWEDSRINLLLHWHPEFSGIRNLK